MNDTLTSDKVLTGLLRDINRPRPNWRDTAVKGLCVYSLGLCSGIGAMMLHIQSPPAVAQPAAEIRRTVDLPGIKAGRSLGVYRVTAYCPGSCCCGSWADGHTADGYEIQAGDKFCAAPAGIPFGTVLQIPGYGHVQVRDRGGAIKGKRLDVFFPSHQGALNWGVKNLEIREGRK